MINNPDRTRTEFAASFATYVRLDEATQTYTDTRHEMACKLLACTDATGLIDLMEAHDLAAILSGCIQVRNAKAEDLHTVSSGLRQYGQPMLVAVEPSHPVQAFLDALPDTNAGCEYYRTMAELLMWASTEVDIRPHLAGATHALHVADVSSPDEEASDDDCDPDTHTEQEEEVSNHV